MQDEFDCTVEDDSEEEVAGQIMGLRKAMMGIEGAGEFGEVFEAVERRWVNRGKMKVDVEVVEQEEEGEWEGISEDDEDGGVDVEMLDAPVLAAAGVQTKEKPKPEIDEDGFTKVTKKRTR